MTSDAAVQRDSFLDLGVPADLINALAPQGITSPTPIQAATLVDSLAGRDVLGRGRTGSGKTYAFLLPAVARLTQDRRRPQAGRPRALILAPTRELALQIEASLTPLAQATKLSTLTVFGGVGQNPQVKALQRGVDVLVACPGRLLDLMGQGHANLSGVEVLVIDEADHMADMGFLPMVRRILDKVPGPAQKMLFSATLDEGVGVLVTKYLKNPVTHEADSAVSPVATMDHHVVAVDTDTKLTTLANLCAAPGRTIVFTRTKYGAKKAAKQLRQRGVAALELHGNLSQNARTRNLDAFHSGTAGTLVATDIAARGIHVDDVALVVHADPPAEHKAYLHRSGRTARAGQAGTVITLAGEDQRGEVRSLMKAAKITPTIHADGATEPLFDQLAPGPRTFLDRAELERLLEVSTPDPSNAPSQQGRPAGGRGRGRGRSQGGGGQRTRQQNTATSGERGPKSSQNAPQRAASDQPRTRQSSQNGQSTQGTRGSGRPGNRRAGAAAGSATGGRVYTSETGRGGRFSAEGSHREETAGQGRSRPGSRSGSRNRRRPSAANRG